MRRFSLPWLSLSLVVAGTLAVPLGLRAVSAAVRSPKAAPSYIPAIESPRERAPFDTAVIAELRGARPDYITIGDSMAGSRIDTGDLGRLLNGRGVVGLFDAARGSAFWYLAFKNWIVKAGIKPRTVIFFFRDENLTDPLFRVWPGSLDRVASEREPRLNEILAARSNGAYFRVHQAAQALYHYDTVRASLEAAMLRTPAAWAARGSAPNGFLARMNEEVFKLEALRPMVLADMAAADDKAFDFHKFLPVSVLPEIIHLSKTYGVPVAFVRVQRRPEGHKPPAQSRALQRYVADLASYLAANDAGFHDDWGDPDLPLDMYEDGDHIKSEYRSYYTAVLVKKAPGLFR